MSSLRRVACGINRSPLQFIKDPEERRCKGPSLTVSCSLAMSLGILLAKICSDFPLSSMAGKLTNKTGETLLVYGPKRAGETRDNSLYQLPDERATPDGWDCDGFYVPTDRVADQALSNENGPLAVKYRDFRSPEITKSSPTHYECGLNGGIFKPGEVNWEIPSIPFSSVPGDYPTVPGHVAAG